MHRFRNIPHKKREPELSLGEDFIRRYLADTETQQTTIDQLGNCILWNALIEYGEHDDEKLSDIWQSKMCYPGDILWAKGAKVSEVTGLVIGCTRSGCVVCPCALGSVDGYAEVILDLTQTDLFNIVHITDCTQWMALPSKRVLPQNRKIAYANGSFKGTLLVCEERLPHTLPQACCMKGLKGLTIADMTDVVERTKINYEGKLPVLELELTTFVITNLCPWLDEAQVLAYVNLKGIKVKKQHHTVLFKDGNDELIKDAGFEDDEALNECEAYAKKAKNSVTIKIAPLRSKVPLVGIGAASSPPCSPDHACGN